MRVDPLKYRVLTILCWCCRCASEAVLAEGTRLSASEIASLVRSLCSERLASARSLPVATLPVRQPLEAWDGSTTPCDFSQIAWQLEKRWCDTPRRRTRVIWATRHAARLVGGVAGHLRQPLQLQHDLGVAQVFAHRPARPDETWLGEDVYRALWQTARKEKVPDAVILNSHGETTRVIEFGGRYTRQRLESFHRYWGMKRGIPYEIW